MKKAGKKRRQLREGADELEAGEGVEDPEKVLAALLAHEREENAIRPVQTNLIKPYQADVLLRNLSGVRWKVTNNGNVQYQNKNGGLLFVDRGNRLTFDRKVVTDEELRLALLHSREKWGNRIVLTGADAVFLQRMVKAATELGMEVGNPELQSLQAVYQKQRQIPKRLVRASAPSERNRVITKKPTKAKAVDLRVQITQQIQETLAGAAVAPAATDGVYQGEITHHNAEWIAQRIGKATFVLHARTNLKGELPTGSVEMRYQDGKAVTAPWQPAQQSTGKKSGKGRGK
ncbi:LPD7 domain-containing protein [Chromobacterium piscinae]|uniref:LPD7 domain-containing protein n=1 Tax=Chromobacterium piscinae TaxID=686831 RepID=UPI00360F30F7